MHILTADFLPHVDELELDLLSRPPFDPRQERHTRSTHCVFLVLACPDAERLLLLRLWPGANWPDWLRDPQVVKPGRFKQWSKG